MHSRQRWSSAPARVRDDALLLVARCLRVAIRDLPPRRKGMRLIAALDRHVRWPSRLQWSRHASGYDALCDLTDSVQRSMYFRGTWEPAQSASISKDLPLGGVFVDVGANAGHYTLLASAAVGEAGAVHAVEPSTVNLERLRETVRKNSLGTVVSIYPFALSDRAGDASLVPAEGGASPKGQLHLSNAHSGGGELVTILPGDHLFKDLLRLDVMKIDVEGAELDVLKGCAATIARLRPLSIYVEADEGQLARYAASGNDLATYMSSLNYEGEALSLPGETDTIVFRRRSLQ